MNSFKSFEQSDIRTERIFNLFLFVEHGVITTYGAKYHKMSGTEPYKLARLQSLVDDDVVQSRRFPIPKSFVLLNSPIGIRLDGAICIDSFYELVACGRHPTIFEEAFKCRQSAPKSIRCKWFARHAAGCTASGFISPTFRDSPESTSMP